MLTNIFIGFTFLILIIMLYYLHNVFVEGLTCENNSDKDKADYIIDQKVRFLNNAIKSKNSQFEVIKNAFENILKTTTDFQFLVGDINVTDSLGPGLDISGNFPHPILNFTFVKPKSGEFGSTGHIGKFGSRGLTGDVGIKGPDGYWGALE